MTPIEARDVMFALVKTYCDGVTVSVEWPDTPFTRPSSAAYATVVMRHAAGKQAAFTGADTRLWEDFGVASLTFKCPIASGDVSGYTLARGFQNVLRSTPSSVWIRNVRIRELGSEGGYQQIQVLWDFEYRDQQ